MTMEVDMIAGASTKVVRAHCLKMAARGKEISRPSGWQCNMAYLGVQAVPDWSQDCS